MVEAQLSLPHGDQLSAESKASPFVKLSNKASMYHAQVPYLNKVPGSAIAIIITLILVNALVWAAVGVVLVRIPQTLSRSYSKLSFTQQH